MIRTDRAKKGMLLFLVIAFLAAFSYSVFAQGTLNTILAPFDKYNPVMTYQTHWYLIDCFIYLMILLGVAQVSLSKQFPGRAGKAVVLGVGISLSLAAAFFEYKNNFKLVEKLGPLAIIIVCVLFLWGVYKFAQELGAGGKAFAMLAFAFMFFYLCAMLPSLVDWFARNTNENIRLIWALLNMLALIFLVWGVISLFSELGGKGKETAPWQGPQSQQQRERAQQGAGQRGGQGEEQEQRRDGESGHEQGRAQPTLPTTQPPADEVFYPSITNVTRTDNGTTVEGRVEVRR